MLVALLAIGLAACGAPAAVKFIDSVLEAMVRGAIGKPEGDHHHGGGGDEVEAQH